MLGLTDWAAPSRLAGPWVLCITSLILEVVSFAFSALTLHSAYKYRAHLGSNKTEKKQRTNPQTFHPFKHRLKSRQKEAIKEQTGWHKLTRGAQAPGCGGCGRGDGAAPLPRPRCTQSRDASLPPSAGSASIVPVQLPYKPAAGRSSRAPRRHPGAACSAGLSTDERVPTLASHHHQHHHKSRDNTNAAASQTPTKPSFLLSHHLFLCSLFLQQLL